MKAVRTVIAALCALVLVACGGGSIQAPEFKPVLQSLALAGDTTNPTPTAGQTVQLSLKGAYTCQPGNPGGCPTTPNVVVTNATYAATPSGIVTVDSSGLVTTLQEGTVVISASKDGVTSNSLTLSVGAAVVQSVVVRVPNMDGTASGSSALTLAAGSTAKFKAYAIYSTGAPPQELPGGTTVSWVSAKPSVVTASTPGASTTLTGVLKDTAPPVTITATATLPSGTQTATGTVTVTNSTTVAPNSIITLIPATASIAKGDVLQFAAQATFTDGSTGTVSTDQFTWTSSLPAVATVDQMGLATGVNTTGNSGTTIITATLKSNTMQSGTATLTVGSTTACTVPFPIGSTSLAATSTLCDPLDALLGISVPLCTIANPSNVVDADPNNFATFSSVLGLLFNSYSSITVKAPTGTTFAASAGAPVKTGFVIANPKAPLLQADIAGEVSVTTSLKGVIQQTTSTLTTFAFPDFSAPSLPVPIPGLPSTTPTLPVILVPAASLPNPTTALTLDLLGMRVSGGPVTAAVGLQATLPFDAITLTVNSGLVGALTTLNAYQACSKLAP